MQTTTGININFKRPAMYEIDQNIKPKQPRYTCSNDEMDECPGCNNKKKVGYAQCAGCRQRQKQPCMGGCQGCKGFKIRGYDWCAWCWQVKKLQAAKEKELMDEVAAMFNWCKCGNGTVVAEGEWACQDCLDAVDAKKKVCSHCHTRQLIVEASDMCHACKDAHAASLCEEARQSFLSTLKADQDELFRKAILETCGPLM